MRPIVPSSREPPVSKSSGKAVRRLRKLRVRNARRREPSSIMKLPDELLLNIFAVMEPYEQKMTTLVMMRTCKQLHRSAITALYNSPIDVWNHHGAEFLAGVVNNPDAGAKLQKLALNITENQECPGLTSERTKSLVCQKIVHGIQDHRFTSKRKDEMCELLKAGDPSVMLGCVLFFTPNIRELVIHDYYIDGNNPPTWLGVIPCLTKLESINFCAVSPFDMTDFLRLPKLKTLYSSMSWDFPLDRYRNNCYSPQQYILQSPMASYQLQYLEVHDIEDTSSVDFVWEKILKDCSNLRTLSLCMKVEGHYVLDTQRSASLNPYKIMESLLATPSSAPTLEMLDLDTLACEGPSCAPLLKKFSRLEHLELPERALIQPGDKLDETIFFVFPERVHTLSLIDMDYEDWTAISDKTGIFSKLRDIRSLGNPLAQNLSAVYFQFHEDPRLACEEPFDGTLKTSWMMPVKPGELDAVCDWCFNDPTSYPPSLKSRLLKYWDEWVGSDVLRDICAELNMEVYYMFSPR